jgi:rhamnogalacturonan endolyase
MLRGSPGFYVTAIWSHRAVDAAMAMGETRSNIYAGSIFNWMSVDSTRNRLMNVLGTTSLPVKGAPKECTLWTSGIYNGQYEDKYKFSADFGTQRVWGWSSVSSTASGATGKNVGLWDVTASPEYYNGGPMKRELMCHMGTTILNMMNGGHYCSANDGKFAAGEVWSKTYGPYFVYCNNISRMALWLV